MKMFIVQYRTPNAVYRFPVPLLMDLLSTDWLPARQIWIWADASCLKDKIILHPELHRPFLTPTISDLKLYYFQFYLTLHNLKTWTQPSLLLHQTIWPQTNASVHNPSGISF